MYNSPIHYCPISKVYVALDQRCEDCARDQRCRRDPADCPLAHYFVPDATAPRPAQAHGVARDGQATNLPVDGLSRPQAALDMRQVAEIRQILDVRRHALMSEVGDGESRIRAWFAAEGTGGFSDERLGAQQAMDVVIADLERHRHELDALDDAQARLDAGGFGLCVECGHPIAFERLRVEPETSRCLTCQQAHDRHRRVA